MTTKVLPHMHSHCVISANIVHGGACILQPLGIAGILDLKYHCPRCICGLRQLAAIPDLLQPTTHIRLCKRQGVSTKQCLGRCFCICYSFHTWVERTRDHGQHSFDLQRNKRPLRQPSWQSASGTHSLTSVAALEHIDICQRT